MTAILGVSFAKNFFNHLIISKKPNSVKRKDVYSGYIGKNHRKNERKYAGIAVIDAKIPDAEVHRG